MAALSLLESCLRKLREEIQSVDLLDRRVTELNELCINDITDKRIGKFINFCVFFNNIF